jgi:hypothetical protein
LMVATAKVMFSPQKVVENQAEGPRPSLLPHLAPRRRTVPRTFDLPLRRALA